MRYITSVQPSREITTNIATQASPEMLNIFTNKPPPDIYTDIIERHSSVVRIVRPRGAVGVENVPVDTAPSASLTQLLRSQLTGLPSLSVRREIWVVFMYF